MCASSRGHSIVKRSENGAARGTTELGSQIDFSTAGAYREMSLDTEVISQWVAQPATNLGLILVAHSDSGIDLDSSDADPDLRPFLRVTYRLADE